MLEPRDEVLKNAYAQFLPDENRYETWKEVTDRVAKRVKDGALREAIEQASAKLTELSKIIDRDIEALTDAIQEMKQAM